jgi:hypothetical protein
MSTPEAIVRARVAKWRPVLAGGSRIDDRFPAGNANVDAIIRPGLYGDQTRGIAQLEARLVAAVNAVQGTSSAIDVRVRPDEELGLDAVAKVTGIGAGNPS